MKVREFVPRLAEIDLPKLPFFVELRWILEVQGALPDAPQGGQPLHRP